MFGVPDACLLCTSPPLEPVGEAERNVHGMNNLNANLHPPAVLRGRNVEAYASQRLGDKGQRPSGGTA